MSCFSAVLLPSVEHDTRIFFECGGANYSFEQTKTDNHICYIDPIFFHKTECHTQCMAATRSATQTVVIRVFLSFSLI